MAQIRFLLLIPCLLALQMAAPGEQPQKPTPIPLKEPILRHACGLQALEAHVGKNTIAYNAALAWRYCCSFEWQFKLALTAAARNNQTITYYALLLRPAWLYTVVSDYRNLFFSLLLAPVPLYEYYHQKEHKIEQQHFNFAFALGSELEYFFHRQLALILAADLRLFLRRKPYGLWGYQLSIGLGFHF